MLTGRSPMPGAREKISSLRSRFDQLSASVTKYEARVARQVAQLAKRNRRGDTSDDISLGPAATLELNDDGANEIPITAEDLEREEQGIRELERKKRALEARVSGMERDLGGLLR